MEMASLSRGISFRRQGSSGMSWTDTWTFNEEGELVRKPKEEHGQLQRFAGSSLSRIHDSTIIHDDQIPEDQQTSCPPSSSSSSSSTLERSKSVGSKSVGSSHVLPRYHKPSPSIFRWIKKTLLKLKK